MKKLFAARKRQLQRKLRQISQAEDRAWSRWESSKATGPADPEAMRVVLACYDERAELLGLYGGHISNFRPTSKKT